MCSELLSIFIRLFVFLLLSCNRSFIYFLIFILYWSMLISNAVLASGVQQSDSVVHIHASLLLKVMFPPRLSQNIEQFLVP